LKQKTINQLLKVEIEYENELDDKIAINALLSKIEKSILNNRNKVKLLEEEKDVHNEIGKLENELMEIDSSEVSKKLKESRINLSEYEVSGKKYEKEIKNFKEEIESVNEILYELEIFYTKQELLKKKLFHLKELRKDLLSLEKINETKLKEIANTSNEILNLEKIAIKIRGEISNLNLKIRRIEVCRNFFSEYTKIKEELKLNAIRKDELLNELKGEKSQFEDLQIEISKLENYKKKLNLQIENEKSIKMELEEALAVIRKYIKDGICPVCNSQHSSNQTILDSIDRKTAKLSYKMKGYLIKLNEITNSVETSRNNFNLVNRNLDKLKMQLIKVENLIKDYTLKVKQFEVQLSELELPQNQETIEFEYNKQINSRMELQKSIKSFKIDDLKSLKSNLELEQNACIEKKDNVKLMMASYEDEIERINKLLLKLNHYNAFIKSNDSDRIQQINNYKEKKSNLDKDCNVKIEKFKNLKKLRGKIENEIEKLRRQENDAIDKETQIQKRKSKLTMSTLKEVESNLSLFNEIHVDLEKIKSSIFTYNELLDYEKLAIKQKELSAKIKENKENNLAFEKRKKILIKIQNKIVDISKALESYQFEITEDFCSEVEPLISSIQGRLRNLYGFTDISLKADRENNEVKLRFNFIDHIEEIKPSAYLSEGQKNILNLSLFLSTTLSQNWSNLNTIFLDDPIRNFDDLNTYAFLELLKDLIITDDEKNKKQIIISTCDKQFFKLIQQKFLTLHKKGKVKYYNFTSLSKNGPIIDEM